MIQLYVDLCSRIAVMSSARRLQVGALIVKDGNIQSFGWNGMPAGWDNNCEDTIWNVHNKDYVLKTKPEVLHAERNALDKLTKRGGAGGENATMFITHAPCLECAKSIYGAGIKTVYYKEDYRSQDGIVFLQRSGVEVIQVDAES